MSPNTQSNARPAESDRDQAVQTKNADACPVVQTVEAVGTTWRLQVLYALDGVELRFNELKRATEGRSKTLSDALEVLGEHGLVARRMEADEPVAVYYTLTEKGQAFIESLDDLERWAVEWIDDVQDPERLPPRV